VSARTSGDTISKEGISLFLIDKRTKGLSFRHYETVDGLRASEVSLNNVMVESSALLGELDKAYATIESVVDSAAAAICAEGVGVVAQLREKTVEYLKTRKQFNQVIGHFQVLQHRVVDMFMAEEQMRSLAYLAAIRVEEGKFDERTKSISAAKVDVAHYVKRLTMLNTLFGDRDYHLQRFSRV